jgi:hypothetical protein
MRTYMLSALCMLAGLMLSTQAQAYMGPGAGLSAIGSFLSLIAAFFFAIVGFIWYPVRRLFKKRPNTAPDGK